MQLEISKNIKIYRFVLYEIYIKYSYQKANAAATILPYRSDILLQNIFCNTND